MTHRGGLRLSIIIWRIGGGGAKFPFALGPKNSLGGPVYRHNFIYSNVCNYLIFNTKQYCITVLNYVEAQFAN